MNTNILISSISTLCNQHDISINKMLQDVGLSKSLVDNLKKGSMPSIDKITKIADYFGVTVDYLLGKTDVKTEKPADEGELTEDIIIYHRNGKTVKRKFTKEQLALFHAMLDAMPESPKDI